MAPPYANFQPSCGRLVHVHINPGLQSLGMSFGVDLYLVFHLGLDRA